MSGASGAYARPDCAEECRRVLLDIFAERGADVHVTWAPPLFPTGYEPLNLDCPHGVPWFAEPAAEQRLTGAAPGACVCGHALAHHNRRASVYAGLMADYRVVWRCGWTGCGCPEFVVTKSDYPAAASS